MRTQTQSPERSLPTAFVIGSGTVAARCTALLLERGWEVVGVYSADGSLEAFADDADVEHLENRASVRAALARCPVDYVFSINNPWILKSDIVSKARRRTINFHDSLLPRYAGLHATSWAILAGETEHGISWHEVRAEIDAGDILQQARFPVHPRDTALSLNARALEAAIGAFEKLVPELEAGTERAVPQRGGGTYFGLHDRPWSAGVISWRGGIEGVERLVRALDFGHAPNPLGRAKLALPGGVVAVDGLDRNPLPNPSASSPEPGATPTLVAVKDGGLRMSVAGEELTLRVSGVDGEPLDASALGALGARPGAVLDEVASEDRSSIHAYNHALAAKEGKWVDELARADPVGHPFLTDGEDLAAEAEAHRLAHAGSALDWATALAAYMLRVSEEAGVDLGWVMSDVPEAGRDLFAPVVPLRIEEPDGEASFETLRDQVEAVLRRTRSRRGFGRDLPSRYPQLRGRPLPHFPVAILELSSPTAPRPKLRGSHLLLVIFTDGSPAELVVSGAKEAWQGSALARHLTALLAGAQADPAGAIHRLPLMDAAERKRVLRTWNETSAERPSKTLHSLVQEQAERTPEAPAVSFVGAPTLSYRALEARANRMARTFIDRGVRPGDRVAIYLPRGTDPIAGMLAAAKAGAAYVPVDPNYPAERVRYLLEDSQAALTLTTASLEPSLPEGTTNLRVDADEEDIAAQCASRVDRSEGPEAALYVIYTSGTTGRPKGVVISHAALLNHTFAMIDRYRIQSDDRMLQSASLAFDVAGEQIWPSLVRGSEVLVRPETLLDSLDDFHAFVGEEGITLMTLPTAFWNEWVGYLEAHGARVPSSVRTLAVGTEKAMNAKLRAFRRAGGERVRLLHGYGPTEAAITCTMHVIEPDEPIRAHEEMPIGLPLENTELYILDGRGEPLPPGLPGELFVGGRGLALGYHERPDLTAKAFVPSPVAQGRRLYATGDRVRQQPDGTVLFVGRDDGQVKIRGHRVELGEIEAELLRFPGVREAMALIVNERLVGYVVGVEGHRVDGAALVAHLGARLPRYMVPSSMVVLPRWPFTPNGKIDRRALPTPSAARIATPSRTAPRNDIERSVGGAFERHLGIHEVDIHASFFDLGGTSLVALRLVAELRRSFETELSLGQLLEKSTVAEIAELLRKRDASSEDMLRVVPLQPHGEHTPLYFICGVHLYARLAQGLGPDRPCFGVYLPEEEELLNGNLQGALTVENLAERYAEALIAHRPEGPLALAGISFGGTLAFEIARQLQAMGRELESVILLDPVRDSAKLWTPLHTLRSRGSKLLRNLWSRLSSSTGRRLEAGESAPSPPRRSPAEQRRGEAYHRAMRRYDRQRPRYCGKVVVVRAADHEVEHYRLRPDLGWGRQVEGELRLFTAPGDHLGILAAPETASILREELAPRPCAGAPAEPRGVSLLGS